MTISLLGFAVILLIAYWWSDSGALSAFLHFACVAIAGAIAFALWEPAAYALLAGPAGNYAKGTVLLALFLVSLLLLRMAADRLVPADIAFPKAANMGLGIAFGAASGVLSVGMLLLGAGFIQSTVGIGDLYGWSRRSDVPTAPTIGSDDAPILHVVDATASFYGYLSWGAFSPWFGIGPAGERGTLGTHMPQLQKTALSLYRDSFSDGMGRVSIPPAAVNSLRLVDIPAATLGTGMNSRPEPAWGVEFAVTQDGFDGDGSQFVASASQMRLLGDGKGGEAEAIHPVSWTQPDKEGVEKQYYFNNPTNYATSAPSQGDGRCVALFAKSAMNGQSPRYFELKGVRFRLPAPTAGASVQKPLLRDADATDISAFVEFPNPKYSLKGITINLNSKGALDVDGSNYILRGEQEFPKGGMTSVSAELQVRGFRLNDDECVLRLDASARDGGARLFPDLNPWITEGGRDAQTARIAVIDGNGAKYYAVGLVWDRNDSVVVKSGGGTPLSVKDVPIQSLGGGTSLTLYFRVPTQTKFAGLVLSTAKEDRLVNTFTATSPKKE